MNEETISKVLTGETDIAKMSHDDFVKMLKCLDRMYFSRVMNCVDGTGRFDKEWTALSYIFRRVVEAIEKPSGNSAATATTEKSSVVGDAAKLREALLEVVRRLEPIVKYMHPNKEEHIGLTTVFAACEPIYKIANAALAAPARNCDVISNRDDAVRLFQAAFVEAVARHLHLTNAAYVKIIEPLGELLEIAIEVLYSTYHAEDSAAQNKESEVSHGNA